MKGEINNYIIFYSYAEGTKGIRVDTFGNRTPTCSWIAMRYTGCLMAGSHVAHVGPGLLIDPLGVGFRLTRLRG